MGWTEGRGGLGRGAGEVRVRGGKRGTGLLPPLRAVNRRERDLAGHREMGEREGWMSWGCIRTGTHQNCHQTEGGSKKAGVLGGGVRHVEISSRLSVIAYRRRHKAPHSRDGRNSVAGHHCALSHVRLPKNKSVRPRYSEPAIASATPFA